MIYIYFDLCNFFLYLIELFKVLKIHKSNPILVLFD